MIEQKATLGGATFSFEELKRWQATGEPPDSYVRRYARFRIQHGRDEPFDGGYHEEDWSILAARAIMADMTSRLYALEFFRQIEPDTRREMVATIASLCRESLNVALTATTLTTKEEGQPDEKGKSERG